MNQLSVTERAQIIRLLSEGTSLRAVSRITGVARNTITKLLVDVGAACMDWHDRRVRCLTTKEIQCDEIWAFVGCKEAHLAKHTTSTKGRGDVWTWTALDADSKLLVSFAVGTRDAAMARDFMADVADRLSNRVQLTTDGHTVYLRAVADAFRGDVDYAMLQKHYGKSEDPDHRYSPPVCTGASKLPLTGNPDPERISTSYVERHNLTIRMHNRRFTRLTNAFSKKIENHEASIGLFATFYNFARPHQTLTRSAGIKTTPAMAAGITDHVWTAEEVVALIAVPSDSCF